MAAERSPLKTPAARIQRGFAMLKPCNLSHARDGCEQRGIGSTAKFKSVNTTITGAPVSSALGVRVVHSASMADRVLVRTAPFTPRSGHSGRSAVLHGQMAFRGASILSP